MLLIGSEVLRLGFGGESEGMNDDAEDGSQKHKALEPAKDRLSTRLISQERSL